MKKSLLTTIITLFSLLSFAQQGKIAGRVLDKDQNLPLPGATLTIKEINKNTISDENGYYEILNIAQGKYTLKVSYIGYETTEMPIEVSVNSSNKYNIKLGAGVVEGKEVIVMGDRLKGQAKALNTQKNNVNVTNVVAADQIGRFPDANIGDALKRIPGLTVQNDQGEARYGLVRGLEARLNSVMFNGERIPAADGAIRSVQLDIIPSDMIQSIQVNKAITPEMDADAIGGAINLTTRSAPEKRRISATLGSGYNFLTQKPVYQGSLVLANRFLNNKLGVVLSGTYNNYYNGSHDVEYIWGKTSAADGSKPYLTDMQVRNYDRVWRIRRSGSVAMDYRIKNHSKITFNGILNRRDDYENRFRLRYRFNNGAAVKVGAGNYAGFPDANGVVKGARVEIETKGGSDEVRNSRLERQTTYSATLGGEHLLGNTLKMNWSVTSSYASENRPEERYITFRMPATDLKPDISNPMYANVAPVSLAYDRSTFRAFQERNDFTDERDLNGRLDFQLPIIKQGDYSNTLKFGGRVRTKEKNRANSRGNLVVPTGTRVNWVDVESASYNETNFNADQGQTSFLPGLFVTPAFLGEFPRKYKTTYVDSPVDYIGDNFVASEDIYAGYVQLSQNLGKKFFALTGLRFENTKINYTGNILRFNKDGVLQLPVTPQSKSDSYLNILPSLHLKYDASESSVVRAAVTTSLARPNYIDLVPRRNQNLEELTEGNPALLPSTAFNLDLMYEKYFKTVGLFSAGVFHKNIKNFIYQQVQFNYRDPQSGTEFLRRFQPQNGASASLSGFEVAFQRQLDFLPGFLKGFGIYTNYTFNDSKVNNFPERENEKVPLPGTAKHNLNASLSYETKKLVLRLSYNFHSAFIDPEETSFSGDAFFDRYQDRMQQLDFNGSYAFTPKIRVFAEANNLTNQPLRFYQGSREFTAQAEYYNVKTNFGFKFDF